MNKFETIDSALYAEKAAEPTKPPLLQEVSVLHRLLEEVGALVDKLSSRLHPVTRVAPESEEVTEAVMVPRDGYDDLASPLLGDIHQAQRQARDLSRRLIKVIDTVDL